MSADILKTAARALREETGCPPDAASRERADETRERLMDELSRRRRGPLRKARWLVPLAALVIASSAWASGQLNGMWIEFNAPPSAPVRAHGIEQAVKRTNLHIEAVTSELPPSTPSPQAVLAENHAGSATATAPPEAKALPVSAATPPTVPDHAPTTTTAAKQVETTDAKERTDALYRRAHQVHFGSGDPAQALGLWEGYLREAPSGRFAPEAHYNRALCLVRLGRTQLAIAALRPFADGGFGHYRKKEAQSLIEALRPSKPATP